MGLMVKSLLEGVYDDIIRGYARSKKVEAWGRKGGCTMKMVRCAVCALRDVVLNQPEVEEGGFDEIDETETDGEDDEPAEPTKH